MMGRTHKAGGVLAGVLIGGFLVSGNPVSIVVCTGALIGGCIMGSLLPDIDKKESTIGRTLWFISWPIYFFRLLVKLFAYIFPGILKKAFQELEEDTGHRALAHSLITWAVLSGSFWMCRSYIFGWILHGGKKLLSLIPMKLPDINHYIGALMSDIHISNLLIHKSIGLFIIGTSIGMLSHLFLDLFTPGGVALLSPVIDKKVEIPIIKTNGLAEKALGGIMTIAAIWLAYKDIIVKI